MRFPIRTTAGLVGLCLVLAACSGRDEVLSVDGQSFRGVLSSDRSDRAAFVTRGGPASAGLDGARQAAVFRAVEHCIEFLGSSDIAWIAGPDVPDTDLTIDDDTVVLTGRCAAP